MAETAPIIKQDKEYEKFVLEKFQEFNSNGKKTVVHFCDTFYPCIDGVIIVLDNYATQLSKFYNVVVVVPKHDGFVCKQSEYVVLGVNSMFFKFVNYDLAFPNTDGFAKKALSSLNIDLIHSHSPFNMGKFAAKIAQKRKIPLVMTMHSQYKQDFEKYVKNKAIVNSLVKGVIKTFNKATEVWTMHHMTADIIRSYGYKGDIFFMPNACHLPIPENRKQLCDDFNKMYNISSDKIVFFFLGRIVSQKNIFFIIDALKLVEQKGIDFVMYFIGSGPDEEKLQKYIDEKGLHNKVILIGRTDDRKLQAKFYQRADLFLFPSKYDTSSVVQIEAALHETPGVYLKNTATAVTITDKVNGYLSDDSVEAYAQTICDALADKEKLKEVSKNAFEQLYITYAQLAEKMYDRYEYLMEQNKTKK